MRKILAIDDQRDNLITIRAVIKSHISDCVVLLAQSGKEGLAVAEKEQPDAILLDIIMPEMDGYAVCKKLKESPITKHIPVVMVTAIKTDAASRARGLNMGADAFLSKPIEPIELSAQVNVMLRVKAAEDKLRGEKFDLEELVAERTFELKESEKKYKALYYDAPLPYQSLNKEGEIIDVNKAWLDLLGYDREEVLLVNFGDFIHPAHSEDFKESFPLFKIAGTANNVSYKIRHKDGNYLDILLDGSVGYGRDGNFKQSYCVFRDITERNKIQEALKLSEEKFRKAFLTSPDSVNINRIDDGHFVSVNESFTRVTGYTEEEVLGRTSKEFNIWVDIKQREELVRLLKSDGRVENMEAQFRKKDGGIIYGLMSSAVIILDNVPHHINITRDVTERKKAESALVESERKLNTLLNNLQGIAYRCKPDREWTMEFISDGFESITGYSSQDILSNNKLSFNDIIFHEDRKKVAETINSALKKKKGFELQYRIQTVDGEIKYVLEKGVGIYDEETQSVVALEGFISDITQQVIADKALKESEEKFRFLAKNSVDCIWTMDKSLRFTYLSPALHAITGYQPETWLGTKLNKHFTRKEFFKVGRAAGKAIKNYKTFKSVTFESKVLDVNNNEVEVEITGSAMKDKNGKLLGLQGTTRDITERIKAREALVESEKKFKELTNLLPQIVFETDLKGKLTYINKLGLETFGYTEKELRKGIDILKGIAPEDRGRVTEIIRDISENKLKSTPEFMALRKSGEKFPILIYASIIHKEESPVGIRGVIVDITQQKASEQELRENEEKLRLIFNNSPVGISITNLEGRFIDANPALAKITGYSQEEMLSRHFNEFSHPEDIALNQEKFQNLVKGNLPYFELEKRYIHKNGNIVYVLIRSQLIYDHLGEPMFQTAMIEDITERIRAEKIRKVLYNISNAVVNSVDLEKLIQLIRIELGAIIDTTNFYVALYDELTNTITLPFFTDEKEHHSFIPPGKSLTQYVIDTQKSLLANVEAKQKLVDEGKLEHIGSLSKVWLGVPLKAEGKITGVLAVQSYTDENAFSDLDMKMLEFVSEQISISIQRVKAEEELKNALNKANESDRLKSSFLATMSHELRTPLNAIIGFSEFFKQDLPPEEVEEFGQIINTSGNHLLSIVNDLFDITLIESGETKIKKGNTELKTLMTDVYNLMKSMEVNESKDLSIEFVDPDPMYDDIFVYTDSNRLKQILTNLLKNAYKFTDKGFIRFGYEIIEENEKSFVRFFVEDTGIGISQDKQDVIFDIFRQVEESNTRRYGGAGIGLSVAKRLTELLGGRIWLESDRGKGSVFYFTIPYEQKGKLRIPPQSAKDIPGEIKEAHVLVVEDDESSFYFLKTFLERAGLNVIHAVNGKEAVETCLANSNVQLVLMDINLPIMNGYEATRQIKAKRPELPIIAQTAYAVAGDREKAFNAGCDDYVSKPIDVKQLIQKLEKLLNYQA